MKNLIDNTIGSLSKIIMLLLLSGSAAQLTFAFDYPEEGDVARGSKAWADNCARCHNMRSPSDLRDDQWITTAFHMRVRAGLTGQETRDILTFLQASNGKVVSKSTAVANIQVTAAGGDQGPSGKQIYESNCMACHGADGKGVLPGTPDFTASNGRLLKSDGELLSNIINGFQSPGSSMPMPPRGGNSNLSDADIQAVLNYLKVAFSRSHGGE